MQNLNSIDKIKEVQNNTNLEGAAKAPSKFGSFINIAIVILILTFITTLIGMIIMDNIQTKRHIKAQHEAFLNSPEMQKYRAEKEKMSRELAQKRRLTQLGINRSQEPVQKNDFINTKLQEQEEKQTEEIKNTEVEQKQGFDYQAELAAYKAKLAEVRAEEARLQAEAQAAAEKAEQERLEWERQDAQRRAETERRAQMAAAEQAERERQAQIAQQQREEQARANAEFAAKRAEMEAKVKAAQAKAAAARAKIEAMKTQKNTLQTTQSNFGSGGSFAKK